jgi:Skp family chaperone for outer membrane proteins
MNLRPLLLSALVVPIAAAQFPELAATDDGRLFFSSRRARGSENLRSKVYRVSGEGLGLSSR